MLEKKINIEIAKNKYVNKKIGTKYICELIELDLRKRQRLSRKNKTNIRWFYENFEL